MKKRDRFLTLGVLAALALIVAYITGHGPAVMAAIGAGVTVFGMILDERTEFADATSVINAAGLFLVGDVYDMTVARNLGNGRPLWLVIQVDTTLLAAAGAASVSFVLASDAQAAIAVDGSATVHFETQVTPKATFVAGYQVCCIPLPGEGPVYEQFLGVLVRIATNPLTAGKVNAFLTTNPKQWKALPDGNSGI